MKDTVSLIRERVSIREIIGRYVSLRKAGKNLVGLCPFHSEKTPSFNVSEERGLFYCFGCGEGGDVFKFLTKVEGRSFSDVLKELSDLTGIPLPERKVSEREREERGKRDRFFGLNSFARTKYHQHLLNSAQGRAGLKYLEGRGIDLETARTFEIGLAPQDGDFLVRAIKREGFSMQDALDLGLVIREKEKGAFFDRFRGRIIFPVISPSRKVVGFGGRALGDDPAKYMNSPASPVYNKSITLYGIHVSAPFIRREEFSLVVEGYFDLISLYRAGIRNVVATCGTALTSDFLNSLSRYTENIYIFFDADEAGLKATEKALSLCLDAGLWPYCLRIPEGLDPDDYARERGEEGLRELINGVEPLFDFILNYYLKKHGGGIGGAEKTVRALIPFLVKLKPVKEGFYTRLISQRIGIREEIICEEIKRGRKGSKGGASIPPDRGKVGPEGRAEPGKGRRMEERLLSLILNYPRRTIPVIKEYKYRDFLLSGGAKEILEYTCSLHEEGGAFDPPGILGTLKDEGLKNRLSSLYFNDQANLDEKTVEILLRDLLQRFDIERLKGISRIILKDIEEAEKSGDFDRVMELLRKKKEYDERLFRIERR